jgi:hypothetical protein
LDVGGWGSNLNGCVYHDLCVFVFELTVTTFSNHPFTQVHDYQVAVKLGRGKMVIQKMQRMLHILFALNDYAYSYAIVTSLLVWAHQKANNTAAWQVFMNNCAIFNEESGELSFGVLAGANVGDTKTANFNHMNELYSNLRVYMSASHGMRVSSGNSEFKNPKHGRNFIKKDSAEVEAVTAYIKSMIRSLRRNRHQMYSGEKEGYSNSVKAHCHQIPLCDVKHFLAPSFVGVFRSRAIKIDTKLRQRFLLTNPEYQTDWPELAIAAELDGQGFSESESEEDFGEGEGAEDEIPIQVEENNQNADIQIEKNNRDKENHENDCEDNKHEKSGDGKDEVESDEDEGESSSDTEDEFKLVGSDAEDTEYSDSDGGVDLFDKQDNPEPRKAKRLTEEEKKDRDMSEYFNKPQLDRENIWNKHSTVNRSNILSGSRKRTRPNLN